MYVAALQLALAHLIALVAPFLPDYKQNDKGRGMAELRARGASVFIE